MHKKTKLIIGKAIRVPRRVSVSNELTETKPIYNMNFDYEQMVIIKGLDRFQ